MILSTIPFEYIGRQDIKSEEPLERNHRTIDRDEKRSSQHSDNTHETTISFDGATFFISILRYAHYSKTSQRMPNNTVPGCNPEELRTKNLHAFHRAIEVDWIGRNLSSVMKSSAGSGRMSCNFVAAEFPPTEMTLQTQLKGRVYNTVFHTAGQCANSFQWDKDKSISCRGNNFGGTLGPGTKDDCIAGSVGALFARDWLTRNSKKATYCLNLFLHRNLVGYIFINQTAIDSKTLQETADRKTMSFHQNIQPLVDGEIGSDGYFREREWQTHWNNEIFVKWANAVLMDAIANQTSNDILTLLVHAITYITEGLSGAWKFGAEQKSQTWHW
ncbi:hypothetical protein ACHAXS_014279 [Conticribra weissflogii]